MATKEKKLLFSLTRDDFEWDYFRAGGKGGQNQNKVNSGVRCKHPPSGAVGEARDSRNQLDNRRSAFIRCVESKAFKSWHKSEVARRLGTADTPQSLIYQKSLGDGSLDATVRSLVDALLKPEDIKVEYYNSKTGA